MTSVRDSRPALCGAMPLLWLLLVSAAAAQSFMQPRAMKEVQEVEVIPSHQELPKHVGLDELERLVERRERAMQRTSWALGILCMVALTTAGVASMARSKAGPWQGLGSMLWLRPTESRGSSK